MASDQSPTPPEKSSVELQHEIEELRQKLVQQEHRPTAVFLNLYRAFLEDEAKESKGASMYAAASLAGKWLFRRSVIVGGASILGGIIALTTLWVTWDTLGEFKRQNTIVEKQTQELITQNELFQKQAVAQQRSTNAEILSDLLADIEQASIKAVKDSNGSWKLSKLLLYRIQAATISFEPYVSDTTSFERGQLLLALIDARVAFPLEPTANFGYATLATLDLSNVNLSGAYLENSYFVESILDNANLSGASLYRSYLCESALRDANLSNANLAWSDLRGAYLNNSDLSDVNFLSAKLIAVDLSQANLTNARLFMADLQSVNFTNALGVKLEQLLEAKTLYRARGLSAALVDSIMTRKPELFLHPDSLEPLI